MTFILHSNVNRRFLSKCGHLSRTVSPLKSLICGPVNRLNWVAILRSRILPLWGCDVPETFCSGKGSWPNEVLNATYSMTLPWRQGWKFGLFLVSISWMLYREDKGIICGSFYHLVASFCWIVWNILVLYAWLLTACHSRSWHHAS